MVGRGGGGNIRLLSSVSDVLNTDRRPPLGRSMRQDLHSLVSWTERRVAQSGLGTEVTWLTSVEQSTPGQGGSNPL